MANSATGVSRWLMLPTNGLSPLQLAMQMLFFSVGCVAVKKCWQKYRFFFMLHPIFQKNKI